MIQQDSKTTIWTVKVTTRIGSFDYLRAFVVGQPGESEQSVRKRAETAYRSNSPELRMPTVTQKQS